MLTGVCTESSVKIKDGWLSDDACREGRSITTLIVLPATLCLLIGREKLNVGLTKRGPPMEASEQTEGDLGMEEGMVEMESVAVENPLPDRCRSDAAKGGRVDAKTSSSELSRELNDRGLGARVAKGDRGGSRALCAGERASCRRPSRPLSRNESLLLLGKAWNGG